MIELIRKRVEVHFHVTCATVVHFFLGKMAAEKYCGHATAQSGAKITVGECIMGAASKQMLLTLVFDDKVNLALVQTPEGSCAPLYSPYMIVS